MTDKVKSIIEKNVHLLTPENMEEFYLKLYRNMIDNETVREVTMVLDEVGLNTFDARENLLYSMLEQICEDALTGGEQNLHRSLATENNWYGYDVYNVIDYFDQMSYNLGVILEPTHVGNIYRAPNYFIHEA